MLPFFFNVSCACVDTLIGDRVDRGIMHIIQAGMEFDVLRANNKIAHENYHLLKEHGIKSVDFMGSIGAGKTALIIEIGKRLVSRGKRVCVIAGDVTGDDDFTRFREAGLDAVNCNTGKECHLDANLIKKCLADIDLDKYDVMIIENVGNLVCPAEFDTGSVKNAMILSVPEGHDKPLKYPLIFQVCDVLIINKIDVMPYFDFDMDKVREYAHMRNPNLKIFPISAKTGEGVDAWCDWLRAEVRAWQEK